MPARRQPARPRTTRKPASKSEATMRAFAQALDQVGWRKRNQGLWLQAQRLGKLIAIQGGLEQEAFPPGCCFIHANVPSVNSFCIKRIVEVDLGAAAVLLEIHGDEELAAGHVMLPLESIGWFGFPGKAVPVGATFAGFALPNSGSSPVVMHLPD